MKRGMIVLLALSIVFFMSGVGLTADEVVIQELQTDVSATKNKADSNAAEIQSLKGGLPAEQAAREAADAAEADARAAADTGLQGAIDAEAAARAQADSAEAQARSAEDAEIWNAINATADVTPPTLEHNVPSDIYSNDAEFFGFTLTDNSEVGYLAVQYLNADLDSKTYYAAPNTGSAFIQAPLNLEEGSNDLVLVAADIYGNLSKTLLSTYRHQLYPGIGGSLKYDYWFDSYSRTYRAYKEGVHIELVPGSSSIVKIVYQSPYHYRSYPSSYDYGLPIRIAILSNNQVIYEKCGADIERIQGSNTVTFSAEFPIDTTVDGSSFDIVIYSRAYYIYYDGTATYSISGLDGETGGSSIWDFSIYMNDYVYIYSGPDGEAQCSN